MNEFIITEKQIKELNKAYGGMKTVTSWLSCYAIWDTSNTYPVMKSEHVAVELPEIVRCRDCRHYTEDDMEYYHYCGSWCEQVKPDGFCAWGEKVVDE